MKENLQIQESWCDLEVSEGSLQDFSITIFYPLVARSTNNSYFLRKKNKFKVCEIGTLPNVSDYVSAPPYARSLHFFRLFFCFLDFFFSFDRQVLAHRLQERFGLFNELKGHSCLLEE